MADDLQQEPLTQEEQAYMDTPVTVQVAPDNQQWLSTLLEMRPEELRNYAIYNYQIPIEAAKAVGRNELIQLIVTANIAGQTGSSVLRSKYRYLPRLRGILPPEVTQRRGRSLYLTRGEADTMQVRDKRTDEWVPYRKLVPTDKDVARTFASEGADGMANEFSPAGKRAMAEQAEQDKQEPPLAQLDEKTLDTEVEKASEAGQSSPSNLPPEVVLAALPKMNRGDLEKVAKSLGVSDTSDAKFPAAKDLRAFIETALKAPVNT